MFITTNIKYEPTIVKCDRCKKQIKIYPFSYGYAPMCGECRTLQTLCEECHKKGCIRCGTPISRVIY